MASGKWQPFCLGLNVLKEMITEDMWEISLKMIHKDIYWVSTECHCVIHIQERYSLYLSCKFSMFTHTFMIYEGINVMITTILSKATFSWVFMVSVQWTNSQIVYWYFDITRLFNQLTTCSISITFSYVIIKNYQVQNLWLLFHILL